MRTLGLVGGMSWVSSVDYYRLINEGVHRQRGGSHYARCILYSFDFADIRALVDVEDWTGILELVTRACQTLASAGAEGILLCANTPHLVADDLRERIEVPILNIADATAEVIARRGLGKVGLLGTRFTMERDFFRTKLSSRRIETILPPAAERDWIHASILDELGNGIFTEDTKRRYLAIMGELAARGAEGIVLGCPEIPLLVGQADVGLPLYDTVRIHAEAGVEFALGSGRDRAGEAKILTPRGSD